MTLCNLSIESGARGGMIAPDETTFNYMKGREFAPEGEEWEKAVEKWKKLKSDENAVFDTEYTYDAADIEPMITYGTNPGMGIGNFANNSVNRRNERKRQNHIRKIAELHGLRPW
jgi:3-isopropylmalate/(R)-2-methylmalate dehydratase large subunit